MKKIMFIAAVVAAGLVQAASVQWAIAPKAFTMSDGSKPNGASVYIFDTGADGYTAFIASLAGGELGDSISASTFTGASGYLGSGTTYQSDKAAQLNVNYGKANGTVTVDNAGDTYNLAAVVFDDGKYLVSDAAAGVAYASNPDDGSLAQFTAGKMTAGSWATYTPATTPEPPTPPGPGPIPEPTSGLLLLVGGAMLALRRKQK